MTVEWNDRQTTMKPARFKPKLGVSLMPSDDFREASRSLFENNKVEVLEWSFDFSWLGNEIAPWCADIIDRFSKSNKLIGHGVTLSPLSARFSKRQEDWLARVRDEFKTRNYIHASEHFGFSEAGPISHGAPITVPMTAESLHAGKEMLKRYAEATQCPVGLENLAFAFSMDDVKRQGEFIDRLISAVDGFLVLDVHNLYCQVANFDVPITELLKSYPLTKVREMHLSGGSWTESESRKRFAVRRDTHDDNVPQEVFNFAALGLTMCPNLEFVILERLGWTMLDDESQVGFREDFETVAEIVDATYSKEIQGADSFAQTGKSPSVEAQTESFTVDTSKESPSPSASTKSPSLTASTQAPALVSKSEPSLADYQDQLVELLSSNRTNSEILEILKSASQFRHYQDYISSFDPDMVSVACELMGKWARRTDS